jgi:NADH-quinone oxidoreductase subunit F
VQTPLTQNIRPGQEPLSLEQYERAGGYAALRKALSSLSPQKVQEEVKASNLRGRGGAGFPTGTKWSFVPMGPAAQQPKYVAINADEMEPGAFKDRLLLEGDPHLVLEGALLTAFAIQAPVVYIFLRWAYKLAARRLTKAIAEATRAGYIGRDVAGSGWSVEVHLHESAGRYLCGEETALLNAIEGQRPTPRSKPPFPQAAGLFGKPTIVNNVETVCNIPGIVGHGAAWFRDLGQGEDSGTKLYGVSGKVNRPGLWELPMGVTARELIEEHAGGMRAGLTLRGFLPGGASTDFLTTQHLDVPMDFLSLQKAGSRLGTGTIIVLDDRTCPVGMVANLTRFFSRESCGWCTPCRDGLPWTRYLLEDLEAGRGRPEDIPRLQLHCELLAPGRTFCPLAPGAMEPLQSSLKFFREDYERHVAEGRCSYQESAKV